ncbi:MAG: DUF4276 family protein [Anaerolineales bacterium]|nr:DUF4276 family protein [Anaerolineales bacterium]
MNKPDTTTSNQPVIESQQCYFFHFGLIVTGKGERDHLPKLFKSLMATGICNFQVIQFTGQRGPITSEKRILEMVGSGKSIPDKDQSEIGLPARRYLNVNKCHFVVLVHDLEHDRKHQAQQVFDRYRRALDTMLTSEQNSRASVHFLVNMLEAYYFADAKAVSTVLNLTSSLEDYLEDVEDIPHPKGELKRLYLGFREREDGGQILDHLNIEHVLSRSDTCASLRTLFAWCSKVVEQYPDYQSLSLADKYHLQDGRFSEITRSQLDTI